MRIVPQKVSFRPTAAQSQQMKQATAEQNTPANLKRKVEELETKLKNVGKQKITASGALTLRKYYSEQLSIYKTKLAQVEPKNKPAQPAPPLVATPKPITLKSPDKAPSNISSIYTRSDPVKAPATPAALYDPKGKPVG
jgi:hypothetical protein